MLENVGLPLQNHSTTSAGTSVDTKLIVNKLYIVILRWGVGKAILLKGKGEYIKGGTATLPVGGSHSITSKL